MQQVIEIKSTGHKIKGRGVFALKDFKENEIIETCPVIIFTPKERKILERTYLNYYIYPWRSTRSAALVFGFGSIYNHSFEPNADWKQNFKTGTMVYRSLRPIKAGEEILINYNGEPDDKKAVDWLEDGKPRKF